MAAYFVRWLGDCDALRDAVHVPQSLLAQASRLPARHRSRFLISRLLLTQLMLRVYGATALPELIIHASGRPAFADPGLPDFSIAYTQGVVGVLLVEKGGQAGLDLEIVHAHSRQKKEQLLQILTSGEYVWINAQPDRIEAATQIWALRQSIRKLTGRKDDRPLALQLLPAAGRLHLATHQMIQVLCDAEQTLVWACALSLDIQRLYLWEIDAMLRWRKLREIDLHNRNPGPCALRLVSTSR